MKGFKLGTGEKAVLTLVQLAVTHPQPTRLSGHGLVAFETKQQTEMLSRLLQVLADNGTIDAVQTHFIVYGYTNPKLQFVELPDDL